MKDIVLIGFLLAVVLAVGCYTQPLEERFFQAESEVTDGQAGNMPEERKEAGGHEAEAPEEEPEELWWPC